MTQADRTRATFARAHEQFFGGDRYRAEFYNYTQGEWNPDTDNITSSEVSIGDWNVEIVPPAEDTTVDLQGTSLDFSTSIRFPIGGGELLVEDGETYTVEVDTQEEYNTVIVEEGGELIVNGRLVVYEFVDHDGTININGTLTILGTNTRGETLIPLGEENREPTEVEITDLKNNDTERFELHSYRLEFGSGMLMCRLMD